MINVFSLKRSYKKWLCSWPHLGQSESSMHPALHSIVLWVVGSFHLPVPDLSSKHWAVTERDLLNGVGMKPGLKHIQTQTLVPWSFFFLIWSRMWPLPACYGCNCIDGGICRGQFFDVGRPIVKVHFTNFCDTLSLDANFRLVKLAICVRLTVVLTCWLLFRVIKGHENVSFSCPVTLQFNRFVICSCDLVSFLANLQTRMVKHQNMV